MFVSKSIFKRTTPLFSENPKLVPVFINGQITTEAYTPMTDIMERIAADNDLAIQDIPLSNRTFAEGVDGVAYERMVPRFEGVIGGIERIVLL